MNTTPPTPSPIKITAETQPDNYMKAILCIGHWDLHHHNLLSACRNVIISGRAFSSDQTAVLTETLDKLKEVMALKTPDWPKPTVTPDAPLGVENGTTNCPPPYSTPPAATTPEWAKVAAKEIVLVGYGETVDTAVDSAAAIIARHTPAPDGEVQRQLDAVNEQRQKCLNSVVEASIAFPNVGAYIAQVEEELTTLRAENDRLQQALDDNSAASIHTCHDNCQRIACVQHREIKRLREALNWCKDFLEDCETAEDRSNLDGDSADAVLEQINDDATEGLKRIAAALSTRPTDTQ